MQGYKYEMRDATGRTNRGVIQAASLQEASDLVRAHGDLRSIAPLSRGPGNILGRMRTTTIDFGPGLRDILSFTNQLAVMIKAGINIRDAIGGIAEQVESAKFRRILQQIKSDVESGRPFSEALAKYPKVFSPMYVNMVRASELSGSLGRMLERIADYLSQQLDTRAMVRGAMIYPAVIFVMATGTTIFCLVFALPRFASLFADQATLLPKPTAVLMAVSKFIRAYWYGIIVAVVALSCGFYRVIHTTWGRPCWDRVKMRIPIFKSMLRALYISQSVRTMGELVMAGAPMLDTLSITADVSGNTLYKRMWQSVQASVRQGSKIARSLSGYRLLPAMVVQMISAGEESGTLGEVLRGVSDYYAKELQRKIKAVTSIIEPLMILVMGVIVGLIAMSILLPIFKMSSLVK